jgi:tripartite-type tricarboxylate transporter receptor subunit TctC
VKDFSAVSQMADLHFALWVHGSVPASSLQELIAYTKANPGKLNYGTGGAGQAFHLAMELLKIRTGIDMVHVPYKGNGPAIQDFIAGRVQAMFYPATGQLMAQMKEGRLRPVAAATDKRMEALPNVPTFSEAGVPGIDSDVMGWVGAFAPAGTPADAVTRLNREIVRVSRLPELAKIYSAQNFVQATTTPQQLQQKMERELNAWGPVIRKLGIQLE